MWWWSPRTRRHVGNASPAHLCTARFARAASLSQPEVEEALAPAQGSGGRRSRSQVLRRPGPGRCRRGLRRDDRRPAGPRTRLDARGRGRRVGGDPRRSPSWHVADQRHEVRASSQRASINALVRISSGFIFSPPGSIPSTGCLLSSDVSPLNENQRAASRSPDNRERWTLSRHPGANVRLEAPDPRRRRRPTSQSR